MILVKKSKCIKAASKYVLVRPIGNGPFLFHTGCLPPDTIICRQLGAAPPPTLGARKV